MVAVVELAGDDVEVVDDGDPSQVEQVLTGAAVAGATALPVADAGAHHSAATGTGAPGPARHYPASSSSQPAPRGSRSAGKSTSPRRGHGEDLAAGFRGRRATLIRPWAGA